MPVYEVGKLFSSRTSWPEMAQYHYMAGEHHLHVFMRQPSEIEVKATKTGMAEFALVVEQDIIFLLYQLSPIPWSDAPYSWHMVPADQRTLPADVPQGKGALLTVMLIDATTGIIKAIRAVGLGTNFTNTLHAAIRDQAARSFDQPRYDEQLNRTYARYPTTDLLLSRAVARYRVGEQEPPAGHVARGRPR